MTPACAPGRPDCRFEVHLPPTRSPRNGCAGMPTLTPSAPRHSPAASPAYCGAHSRRGTPRPAWSALEAGPSSSVGPPSNLTWSPVAARRDEKMLVPLRYLDLHARASPQRRWPSADDAAEAMRAPGGAASAGHPARPSALPPARRARPL